MKDKKQAFLEMHNRATTTETSGSETAQTTTTGSAKQANAKNNFLAMHQTVSQKLATAEKTRAFTEKREAARLQKLQQVMENRKKKARAQTTSGLLPDEAEALRAQREQYQSQLDLYKAKGDSKAVGVPKEAYAQRENQNTGTSPVAAAGQLKEAEALKEQQDPYQTKLEERIAAIDAQLNLYDRIDSFQASRVTPLTSQDGFATARKDFQAGNADRVAEVQKQIDDYTYDATDANQRKQAEADLQRLDSEKTDELGEYLSWYEGLSQEYQQGLLDGSINPNKNQEVVRSTPSSVSKHWERMTADEINAYYYLANTEGMAAAKEFLEELQTTLDWRHTTGREEATREQMAKVSTGANALRGAATAGVNAVAGVMASVSDTVNALQGKEFNPYSNAHYLQNIIGTTRSAAANDIQTSIAGDGESKFWNGVGELAANAYQAGLSTLDSMAGMYTMGSAYTVSMGMGAASSRMRELYESGATDQEIYIGAIGSGILEALFEKVSLESFTQNFIASNPEKWIKKALLQAGVEGSEEFFTEISNQILDAANRGRNSDHNQRVRELMNDPENPMSQEDAEQQAAAEDAMDIFWAAMGGVMSGGMSAAGGAVVDSNRQNQMGKDAISRNVQEDVIAEAQELRENDPLANQLQSKQEAGTLGKKHSDATQLGRLIEKNLADMTQKDMAAVQSAVEARLKEEGQKVRNGEATAEAIVKSLAGEELSVSDRFHLAINEKYVDQVKDEIYSVADGRTANNRWVQNIGTYTFAPGTFGEKKTYVQQAGVDAMRKTVQERFGAYSDLVMKMYRPDQNRMDFVAEVQQLYQAGLDGVPLEKAPKTKTLQDWQREAAWDMGQGKSDYTYDNNQGFATVGGEATPVNIVGVAAAGKGKLLLRTDDGGTVDAGEVTFGSYSESKIYSVISLMGVNASTANEIISMSQESKLDLNEFSRAMQDAFYAGRNGIPFEDIQGGRMAMKLTQEQRKLGWQAGRTAARAQAARKNQKIQQAKHRKAAGGVKFDSSVRSTESLNAQQQEGLKAAEVLAGLGLDITVYASTEQQRAKGMANGHIRLTDGSIRVDLNSGDNGEGVMAWALSHEFTHFVEELSPEKFQTFQELLFEELGQDGQDVAELIDEKAALLSMQQDFRELSEDRLMEIATSEVVAEMMEPMLTDTDAIARISDKMRQQDKGLWEKIKDWITGLVEKLKNAYKDLTPGSTIAQQTRDVVTQSEEILNAWVDVASDAIVNYNLQDGQKKNTPEGVKYSIRQTSKMEWEEQLKAFRNGRMISSDAFFLGDTPAVYGDGFQGNPLVMNQRDYRKSKSEKHNVPNRVLKKVPDLLSRPIMAFTQGDRMVVVLNEIDGDGKPLVAALHANEQMDRQSVTAVTSIYGVDNWAQWIGHQAEKKVKVFDKKRANSYLQTYGSNASVEDAIRSTGDSLSDEVKNVNPEDSLDSYQNVIPVSQRFDSSTDDIRYSQRTVRQLERENEKLRKDREYLKELVTIQRKGNKDLVPSRASVNKAAENLKKETGARGNTQELAELLDAFYRYIGKGGKDPMTMDSLAGKAVEWLQEHQPAQRDPYSQEVLDWLKKRHVSLSESQVDEIKYQYGSLREYQSAIKGSIIIDQKASTTLDQLWQEGAYQFADKFDADMNEGDMPGAFADLVESLKNQESVETAEASYYQEEIYKDLMDKVYDTTFEIKPVDSVSDTMRAKIDALKAKRKADLEKYRQTLREETRLTKQETRLTLNAMQDLRKAALESFRKREAASDQEMRRLYEQQSRLIMDNYQKQLEAAQDGGKTAAKVEGWRKTEERGKLQRTLNKLNKMILNPTKSAYVPDSLQPAVIHAMEVVNDYRLAQKPDMETIRNLRNELDELMQAGAAGNQTRIRQINRQLSKLQGDYGSLQDTLTELKRMYGELIDANEGTVAQIYDEGVESLIADAVEVIKDTEYDGLNVEQLEALNDAYSAILYRIQTANKTFAYGQQEEISQLAIQTGRELKQLKDREKLSGETVGMLEKFGWNNLKPVYAFGRLGSQTMTTLYNNLRKGEDLFYNDIVDARAFALGSMDRHGYQNWQDKVIEFESVDGKKFSLNLEERMSLYAYSRRGQAIDHLMKGGIVLNENTKRTVKGFLGIQTEKVFHDYNNYRLSLETIQEIGASLTEQQRKFAEEMQQYLSTVCAEKNNEISRKLYGVSKAKEKYYWPLKVSNLFSERARYQQQNPGNRQKNAGHMKATILHANNPVEIAGFMETWGNHVNNTAMYHAFTLPMEDFLRVYNFNNTTGATEESTIQLITRKHGKGAVEYIDQLMKDLNQGVRADPRESIGNAMVSKFKKGAVSASLSVAIQQPSAIGRAFAVIDPKYFNPLDLRYYVTATAGEKLAPKSQELWEKMKRYAPVVGIKEMGRFDVNMGQSTVDFITGAGETGLMAKVDEYSGYLPEKMDQATWMWIWNAAERQCKAQGYTGEALNQAVGELFTECITKTQVYDSVFSRSGNMRSKSLYMNMATSFMAEPTTTANMFMNAVADVKNGNWKSAGRKVGSIAVATILNAMLASFVYAARDDDEDSPYREKLLKSFTSELVDSFNIAGYVPVVKDVWSLLQGYDVERADMTLWSEAGTMMSRLKSAYENVNGLDEEDPEYEEKLTAAQKKVTEAWANAAGAVCNLFGVPAKNLLREVRAIINTWETVDEDRAADWTTARYAMWEAFQENLPAIIREEDSKSDELFKAMRSGSAVWVNRMKESYDSGEAFENAVKGCLRDHDVRIRQAAKMLSENEDPTEYTKVVKGMVSEGHFTQDQIEAAIQAEARAIRGEFTDYSAKTVEKFVDLYEDKLLNAQQFTDFWEYKSAEDADGKKLHNKDEMIVYIGKMKVTSKAKDTLYKLMGYSEDALESMPWHTAGYSVWEARVDDPALEDCSDSTVEKYLEIRNDQITASVFADAYQYKTAKDEDGKSLHKQEEVMAYIDSLNLSRQNKDELLLAMGYKESALKKAPWN